MNIQGSWLGTEDAGNNTSGAIYSHNSYENDWENNILAFDASRSWTGETSSSGSHTHEFSLGKAGGGLGHSHTLTGASHSHGVTIQLPPFYRLAFFVKLPE